MAEDVGRLVAARWEGDRPVIGGVGDVHAQHCRVAGVRPLGAGPEHLRQRAASAPCTMHHAPCYRLESGARSCLTQAAGMCAVARHGALHRGCADTHAKVIAIRLTRQAAAHSAAWDGGGLSHLASRGLAGGRLVDREAGVRLRQPECPAVEDLKIGARRGGPSEPRRWHCRSWEQFRYTKV